MKCLDKRRSERKQRRKAKEAARKKTERERISELPAVVSGFVSNNMFACS